MSVNPALVRMHDNDLIPAPFSTEMFVLRRDGVVLDLDGVQTSTGKWSAKGTLYLSNVRLVFVSQKADPSGLQAFDLPLAYIHSEKLNQPIFGCNNLTGHVWPAMPGGGPGGSLPPHDFKVSFREGGIGTFFPLFYTLVGRSRRQAAAQQQAGQQQQQQHFDQAASQRYVDELVNKAFVDPNDPSRVYLAQPVEESQRLSYQPRYAANYGQEERYEDMHLRP